ncbi:MAG: hypothetical protein KAH12_11585 [Anaerolineales bacterium]|nr:hypothetical protein [Anaerolineales bacterium]
MNLSQSTIDPVKIEVVIREGCSYSDRVLDEIIHLKNQFPAIVLEVINASSLPSNGRFKGGITPSIWVNGKLWSLGSYCSETFHQKLALMLHQHKDLNA